MASPCTHFNFVKEHVSLGCLAPSLVCLLGPGQRQPWEAPWALLPGMSPGAFTATFLSNGWVM